MDNESLWQNTNIKKLVSLVLVMLALALGAYTYLTLKQASYSVNGPVTVSVSGEGEVTAKPDIGNFSFSVNTEATDATIAQSENAEVVNEIVAYLEENGVAEGDIDTGNYNLNPTYSYEKVVCNEFRCPPTERVQDGYAVYQSINVKVRDLDKVGMLIAGVGERGATNISRPSFSIDDPASLESDAKAAAIKDAREKAERLAESLGMRLGKIMSFYEDDGYGYEPYAYTESYSLDATVAKVVPEIPVGDDTVRASVNIIYELK